MTDLNTWCLTCLSTLKDGASIPEPMCVFLRDVLHFKCKQLEENTTTLVCRRCYSTLIELKRFYAQLRDVELYLKSKTQNGQSSAENRDLIAEVHDVEEVYTTEFENTTDNVEELKQDPILIEAEPTSREDIQIGPSRENSRILPNTDTNTNTIQGERRFVCLICSKLFSSFRDLRSHKSKHTTASNPSTIPQQRSKRLTCPDCGDRFDLMKGLINHRKTHELEKRKPFRCLNCNRRFVTNEALRDHELIHIEVQTSQCEICHKRYLNHSSLEAHMRVSHNCSTEGTN